MFHFHRVTSGLLLVLVGFSLNACTASDPEPEKAPLPEAAADSIRAVLDAQVVAWNRGSLREFMEGYVQTDSLRFASGGTVRTGWQTTLDRYEMGYPDRAAMGMLRFDSLDVRLLAPTWALVFGRWHLQRAEDEPNGLFTLLLEKRPEGWRIVHDHTSSSD